MQNSRVVFSFSLFDGKDHFGKFGSKNQNCQFKLKFRTLTNLNMQISMDLFTFFLLEGKHPFLTNSVQKMRIVTLS